MVKNVERYGTGALNIDACRIYCPKGDKPVFPDGYYRTDTTVGKIRPAKRTADNHPTGRWPANVVLDEEAGRVLDIQTGTLKSGSNNFRRKRHTSVAMAGSMGDPRNIEEVSYGDSGGVSRFFYCSKASTREKTCSGKVECNHPTVKPVSLMRYLIRLVTPVNGVVLDPFCGSGSTGIACLKEKCRFIGIDLEAGYCDLAVKRISYNEEKD
jgi:site-specific DNA-methyltransferase (adenine-specific)